MLKYLLQTNTITNIPTTVLLLFTSLVIGILWWAYRPGSKEFYQKIATNALDSGVDQND